jgi:hypothetical protein
MCKEQLQSTCPFPSPTPIAYNITLANCIQSKTLVTYIRYRPFTPTTTHATAIYHAPSPKVSQNNMSGSPSSTDLPNGVIIPKTVTQRPPSTSSSLTRSVSSPDARRTKFYVDFCGGHPSSHSATRGRSRAIKAVDYTNDRYYSRLDQSFPPAPPPTPTTDRRPRMLPPSKADDTHASGSMIFSPSWITDQVFQ